MLTSLYYNDTVIVNCLQVYTDHTELRREGTCNLVITPTNG